jgi:hypothetical protein
VVALDIAPNFRNPIGGVVPGGELSSARLKVAAMPKISVTKDGDSVLRKHNIRPTRQIAAMKAIP